MLNDFKCSIIDMGNDVYQEVGRSISFPILPLYLVENNKTPQTSLRCQ